MLQKLNKMDDAGRTQRAGLRPARSGQPGKELHAHIGDLRNLPREKLADAVFLLSMAAKQQSEQIRRSILERAEIEIHSHSLPNGDLADFLAGEAVSFLRHHELGGPSLMAFLSGRSPDVDFTIEQQDAVAMVAAVIREQRLDGILEGLRLAGLLSRPSKNRHDDPSA